MVYEIIKSKYRIFIETLILTLLILLVGFFIGLFVENYRTSKMVDNYNAFEISAFDLKLQNYYYQIMDESSCNNSIEQNFFFADKIYKDGLNLERYEQANQLTKNILLEKKKYVLLKTELWLNSILLKKKCGDSIHTVVYVYSQNEGGSVSKDAEQAAISDVLRQIKEEKGNTIILIPIAGDLRLDIVDLQLRVYNVTSLPVVIIDEKVVLTGFSSKEEIEKFL